MKNSKALYISRIVFALLIIIMLMFPFASAGINIPRIFINEAMVIDLKYFVIGLLYAIDTVFYFTLSSKENKHQELNRVLEIIVTDSVLIILSSQGFIHPIVPIIMIFTQIVINAIKENADIQNKIMLNKTKNILMNVGITLTLFYNLPFELWNLKVSDFLIIVAIIIEMITLYQIIIKRKVMN